MGLRTHLKQAVKANMEATATPEEVRAEYNRLKDRPNLTAGEVGTLQAVRDYLADLGELPRVYEGSSPD